MQAKDCRALVVDQGLFTHVAEALAPQFKSLAYFAHWKSAFPESRFKYIGRGLKGVDRVDDLWKAAHDAHLIILPDVQTDDIADELRRQGKLVWGAGSKAAALEQHRWRTREILMGLGLPVPTAKRIVGVDALRAHLATVTNKFVKHSTFRGDIDTWQHLTGVLSAPTLDAVAAKLGPVRKADAEFIVEDPIDAIEVGVDFFTVDGRYPATVFWGIEIKDVAFIGKVSQYTDLPAPLREVADKFSKALKDTAYRGWMSYEDRITKSGVPYFIDPCIRCASPPSELYMRMFSNWGDVILAGAQGRVVDLEPTQPLQVYGALLTIENPVIKENWVAVRVPPTAGPHTTLCNNMRHEGTDYVVRNDNTCAGRVLGMGSSLTAALTALKQHAKQIDGYGVDIDLSAIRNLEDVVAKARGYGVDLS